MVFSFPEWKNFVIFFLNGKIRNFKLDLDFQFGNFEIDLRLTIWEFKVVLEFRVDYF